MTFFEFVQQAEAGITRGDGCSWCRLMVFTEVDDRGYRVLGYWNIYAIGHSTVWLKNFCDSIGRFRSVDVFSIQELNGKTFLERLATVDLPGPLEPIDSFNRRTTERARWLCHRVHE